MNLRQLLELEPGGSPPEPEPPWDPLEPEPPEPPDPPDPDPVESEPDADPEPADPDVELEDELPPQGAARAEPANVKQASFVGRHQV